MGHDLVPNPTDPKILLGEYPDVVAANRSRVGSIYIIQDLKNGMQRVMDIFQYSESDDQKVPYVKISLHDEPLGTSSDTGLKSTEIIFKTEDDDQVSITVTGNEIEGLDTKDVAKNARRGLELLAAAASLPTYGDPDLTRYRFQQRGVYDALDPNPMSVAENLPVEVINALPEDGDTFISDNNFLVFAQKVLAKVV